MTLEGSSQTTSRAGGTDFDMEESRGNAVASAFCIFALKQGHRFGVSFFGPFFIFLWFLPY